MHPHSLLKKYFKIQTLLMLDHFQCTPSVLCLSVCPSVLCLSVRLCVSLTHTSFKNVPCFTHLFHVVFDFRHPEMITMTISSFTVCHECFRTKWSQTKQFHIRHFILSFLSIVQLSLKLKHVQLSLELKYIQLSLELKYFNYRWS